MNELRMEWNKGDTIWKSLFEFNWYRRKIPYDDGRINGFIYVEFNAYTNCIARNKFARAHAHSFAHLQFPNHSFFAIYKTRLELFLISLPLLLLLLLLLLRRLKSTFKRVICCCCWNRHVHVLNASRLVSLSHRSIYRKRKLTILILFWWQAKSILKT